MLLSVHFIAILERAISISNRQQKMNNSLWPFPCTQREGQLEGHLSGSAFDDAPDIDNHWYTSGCFSDTLQSHNIHQEMKNKKQLMMKGGTTVTFAESTKEVFIKIGEWEGKKNPKWSRGVHALGFALDEERRKRSPEFFLSREWAHQSRCWGGVGGV